MEETVNKGILVESNLKGGKLTAVRNLSIILCMLVCIGVLAYEMTYTIPTAMQARVCNDFVKEHPTILKSWWYAYGELIENSTIAGMQLPWAQETEEHAGIPLSNTTS